MHDTCHDTSRACPGSSQTCSIYTVFAGSSHGSSKGLFGAVPCPGRGDILLQRLHIDRLVLLVHEESVALVQCIHVSEQWEEHAFVSSCFSHGSPPYSSRLRICQTLNEEGWIQESCSIALGFGQLHVRLNPKVTIGHRCGNLEHGIFGLFGAVLDLY